MRLRTILNKILALLATVTLCAVSLHAQEHPAKRLSSIVGVAVEEYGKGIDAGGRMISLQEYQEAVDFLSGARGVAERLSGARASVVRAELDSLSAAVAAKRPPSEIAQIHGRFTAALGAEGALELPTGELSIAAGRETYQQNCASCHGQTGLGDGLAARGMDPAPPAIGDAHPVDPDLGHGATLRLHSPRENGRTRAGRPYGRSARSRFRYEVCCLSA